MKDEIITLWAVVWRDSVRQAYGVKNGLKQGITVSYPEEEFKVKSKKYKRN
jgi:hypothetical protein